jgi:nitroreductase
MTVFSSKVSLKLQSMRKLVLTLFAAGVAAGVYALEPVKLNAPDKSRGKSLMKALDDRMSVREFADREVSIQDLSDILWMANGVNRPDGRRTAPSAMNRQDIKLYVVTAAGSYYYDHKSHTLEPIAKGDFRQKMRGSMPALNLLVVADDGEARYAGVNAGYVSQNIYLGCSALDMATVAAAGMDEGAFKKACKLNDKQKIVVQHPLGYRK